MDYFYWSAQVRNAEINIKHIRTSATNYQNNSIDCLKVLQKELEKLGQLFKSTSEIPYSLNGKVEEINENISSLQRNISMQLENKKSKNLETLYGTNVNRILEVLSDYIKEGSKEELKDQLLSAVKYVQENRSDLIERAEDNGGTLYLRPKDYLGEGIGKKEKTSKAAVESAKYSGSYIQINSKYRYQTYIIPNHPDLLLKKTTSTVARIGIKFSTDESVELVACVSIGYKEKSKDDRKEFEKQISLLKKTREEVELLNKLSRLFRRQKIISASIPRSMKSKLVIPYQNREGYIRFLSEKLDANLEGLDESHLEDLKINFLLETIKELKVNRSVNSIKNLVDPLIALFKIEDKERALFTLKDELLPKDEEDAVKILKALSECVKEESKEELKEQLLSAIRYIQKNRLELIENAKDNGGTLYLRPEDYLGEGTGKKDKTSEIAVESAKYSGSHIQVNVDSDEYFFIIPKHPDLFLKKTTRGVHRIGFEVFPIKPPKQVVSVSIGFREKSSKISEVFDESIELLKSTKKRVASSGEDVKMSISMRNRTKPVKSKLIMPCKLSV